MLLAGRNGVSLKLSPVAYQFPDLIRQRFYSEWLVIDAEVRSPDGDRSFRCGGLLTFEATQLAHWLYRAASGA